jgi:hypothetical protein
MRNLILLTTLLLSGVAFAQRSNGISDTRIGGVRPGTIQRGHQKDDPEVKKEITETSKETGISRGKLLSEFRATQQKLSKMPRKQLGIATASTSPTPASTNSLAFTAKDFHRAKVFSIQNKIPMDRVLDLTAKHGNLDGALKELQSPPQ